MKRFGIKRLSMRLTIWYAFLVVVAFGCVVIFASMRYNKQVLHEKNLVINQKLDLISNNISTSVQEVRALHSRILADPTIKSNMQCLSEQGELTKEQLDSISFAMRRMKTTSINQSLLAISPEGKILDTLYGLKSYDFLTKVNDEFEKFKINYAFGSFSSLNTFPYPQTNINKNNLTYFGTFYDRSNYVPVGYIAINILPARMFAPIKALCENTFAASIMIDQNNNTIFRTGNPLKLSHISGKLDKAAKVEQNTITIDNKSYLVFSQTIEEYPNWRIYGLVDFDAMSKEINALNSFVFSIFLIAFILITFISFNIAKRITTPIRNLNRAMEKIASAQWPEPVEINTSDEMKGLVEGFNKMVGDVKKLTNDIIIEQEEKKKIEVAMVKSKLDLLQNQINPHFIHNTLNAMNYMALQQGNKDLSQTIVSFNALLRASMSIDVEFVTIKEEFGYVQSYMNIQHKRYGDSEIIFTTQIDQEAQVALIPKLIIQPLVENALFHGIIPTGRGGKIALVCMKDGELLNIMVCDDGMGIEKEKLSGMLNGNLPNPRGYNSIGLKNIKERLTLNFKEKSIFKIASNKGLGTMVIITIPYREER